jgi:hypothetical protein
MYRFRPWLLTLSPFFVLSHFRAFVILPFGDAPTTVHLARLRLTDSIPSGIRPPSQRMRTENARRKLVPRFP